MIRESGNRFFQKVMLKHLSQLETVASGTRNLATKVFHVKQRSRAAPIHGNAKPFSFYVKQPHAK
jgi:hypothetical protein